MASGDEFDDPEFRAFKWTETEQFVEDCQCLDQDPGEVDYLRGLIGDNIIEKPVKGSNPLFEEGEPGHDPDLRYFRTLEAPGLSHLQPKFVGFRIEAEPDDGSPRELTGLALWDDPEGS